MNYQKIYDQIIDRARKEQRAKKQGTYYENHHIVPKCLGGSDEKQNLVLLTGREHFICHWILVRICPKDRKLAKAFNIMCQIGNNQQYRYTPSSRTISEAKQLDRQARIGVKKTQEAVKKRTATRVQKNNYKRTQEAISKGIETRRQKNSYKGKRFTAEHRDKLGENKRKQVEQYTLGKHYVISYKSATQAANTLNINISGISRAATGKVESYKGFIWKYA
jgi:hypothetical protein